MAGLLDLATPHSWYSPAGVYTKDSGSGIDNSKAGGLSCRPSMHCLLSNKTPRSTLYSLDLSGV